MGEEKFNIDDLRRRVQQKRELIKERSKMVSPYPPPRYDDVYSDGLKWLENDENE